MATDCIAEAVAQTTQQQGPGRDLYHVPRWGGNNWALASIKSYLFIFVPLPPLVCPSLKSIQVLRF